jgi:hypothetical protein
MQTKSLTSERTNHGAQPEQLHHTPKYNIEEASYHQYFPPKIIYALSFCSIVFIQDTTLGDMFVT